MSEKWNGWCNYETWLIKLWIDNDYGNYLYFKELAERSEDTTELRVEIQSYFEDNNPLSDKANIYSDFINRALGQVDWWEIVDVLHEDYWVGKNGITNEKECAV